MKSFCPVLLVLTILSLVSTTTLAADRSYWVLEDFHGNQIGANHKCPFDATRLFKHEYSTTSGPEASLDSCYEMCRSIQNCHHFSYGFHANTWMCMGCNGHEHGYEAFNDFTVYEINARDDWAFTKVGAKKDCSNQRSGSSIPSITQDECHTQCKNTQGCGYFSMKDMNWMHDEIGSGTCQLCTGSGSFGSQAQSNTYSILSPASYRPVCEGPTAVVWGDPHLITFDRLKYDCQGRGEFVLVKSNGPDPLAIHGVFEDTGGSASGPSVTRSLAILVDDNVPVLHVTIPDMPDADGKCDFSYTLGENETPIAANNIVEHFYNNFAGEANIYTRDKAVVITFPNYQTRVEILVHSGHFARFGCRMRANVCVTPSNHGGEGNIVGLFGSPTGSQTDDWMMNNTAKTLINVPLNSQNKVSARDGTAYCRENWCVPRENSLYGDSTYTAHNKCAEDSFDPDAYEALIEALPQAIKDKCNESAENPDECIADVAVLKDLNEEAGEIIDYTQAAQGFGDEEQDSNTVSDTTEAELYAEEDWVSPDVTTLYRAERSESNGDPHFLTWKKEHFEFHGQCDVVMVRVENLGDQNVDLDIHLRTKMVRFWSYIKTVAIRIGNDILEIEGFENNYWINFESRGEVTELGGFPVTISPTGKKYTIDLSSIYPGQKIEIKTFKEFVGVKIIGASENSFGNAAGITGDFKTGKTYARDGTTILNDFNELGNEWQVLPSDGKLFHEMARPQFPEKCFMPEDPQGERARRLSESTISEEAAEEACAGLKDEFSRKGCVYDILATQDMDMVGAY